MNAKKAQPQNVKELFDEWECLKTKISEAHKSREVTVKGLMLIGIELYTQLLVSTSEINDSVIHDIEKYEILPLNGVERFKFIINKPEHYASYLQLNELFIETKKKIARLRITLRN